MKVLTETEKMSLSGPGHVRRNNKRNLRNKFIKRV